MDSTTTDLARIVAVLIERILALTVAVAITGGCLVIAMLFILIRIGALEQHITDTSKVGTRKIVGKLDDIEFPPR